VPADAPNEILDLHVYCDAAQAIWGTPKDWAAMVLKAQTTPAQGPAPEAEESPTPEEPEEPDAPEEETAPQPPGVRVIRPKVRQAAPVTTTLAKAQFPTPSTGSGAW
jgi:phage terminase large subunit GpA-like protein